MTGSRPTDGGRAAVYAAEIAAFEGTTLEAIVEFHELRRLADRVSALAWWPHGPVEVRRARRDAGSSSTRQAGAASPVVRLAAPQMTRATLVHELAHVLAGVRAGHGPVFRRAYLDLVGAVLGPEPYGWLLAALTAYDLEAGARSWAAPARPEPGAGGGSVPLGGNAGAIAL